MNEEKEYPRATWLRHFQRYEKGRRGNEKPFGRYRTESLWSIAFNLIFLYIVFKIPGWNLPFITEGYGAVLWILVVNILIQIGGNLLIALIDLAWIRYVSRILTESASLVTSLSLYFIFPFDFSHYHGWAWIDWLLPILLIVGMVVSGLKVLANIWKLVFWSR
jgi:hypothetical protein